MAAQKPKVQDTKLNQGEVAKNGGQQLVGVSLDQDPGESVKDI